MFFGKPLAIEVGQPEALKDHGLSWQCLMFTSFWQRLHGTFCSFPERMDCEYSSLPQLIASEMVGDLSGSLLDKK